MNIEDVFDAMGLGPDEDCICRGCGDGYKLRKGCYPTVFCDRCAQEAVELLWEEMGYWEAEGRLAGCFDWVVKLPDGSKCG